MTCRGSKPSSSTSAKRSSMRRGPGKQVADAAGIPRFTFMATLGGLIAAGVRTANLRSFGRVNRCHAPPRARDDLTGRASLPDRPPRARSPGRYRRQPAGPRGRDPENGRRRARLRRDLGGVGSREAVAGLLRADRRRAGSAARRHRLRRRPHRQRHRAGRGRGDVRDLRPPRSVGMDHMPGREPGRGDLHGREPRGDSESPEVNG